MASRRIAALVLLVVACGAPPARAQEDTVPAVDRRAIEIRDLDTPYAFTRYANTEAWLARARSLREQVLVSAGLWPMPEKHPLNAQVFGRIERAGCIAIARHHTVSTILITRPLASRPSRASAIPSSARCLLR